MAAMTGKVIRIVGDKGFGFIRATEGEAEYFFHRTAVRGTKLRRLARGRAGDLRGGGQRERPTRAGRPGRRVVQERNVR